MIYPMEVKVLDIFFHRSSFQFTINVIKINGNWTQNFNWLWLDLHVVPLLHSHFVLCNFQYKCVSYQHIFHSARLATLGSWWYKTWLRPGLATGIAWTTFTVTLPCNSSWSEDKPGPPKLTPLFACSVCFWNLLTALSNEEGHRRQNNFEFYANVINFM